MKMRMMLYCVASLHITMMSMDNATRERLSHAGETGILRRYQAAGQEVPMSVMVKFEQPNAAIARQHNQRVRQQKQQQQQQQSK